MHLIVDGKRYAVNEGIMRIGRSATAQVCLEDATVSRRHAILMREDDAVRVLDDRSLNGVFVNGERVSSRELKDGDVVQIGRNEILFEAPVTRAIAV